MPILEIEIVLRPQETLAEDLADRLANTAAGIFNSPPRGSWVKLRSLDQSHYAENEAEESEPVYPIFVNVLKADEDAAGLATAANRLAEAVGRICNRPKENVHILFEPKAKGRIAFGGKLR